MVGSTDNRSKNIILSDGTGCKEWLVRLMIGLKLSFYQWLSFIKLMMTKEDLIFIECP